MAKIPTPSPAKPTAPPQGSPAPNTPPVASAGDTAGLPPISHPEGADDGRQDVKTFEPAAFNIDTSLDEKKPTTPAGPPAGTPPPAGEHSKQLTPEEIERRRGANESLRRELETAQTRARELEQQEETRKQRLIELETQSNKHKEEAESRRRELEEFRKSQSKIDPRTDEKIIEINGQWDAKKKELNSELSLEGMKAGHLEANIPTLLKKYGELGEPTSKGYDSRRDAFNEVVSENFPGHEREIRKLIGAGFDLQKQIAARVGELSTSGDKIRMDRETEAYRSITQEYDKKEQRFFNPTADLKENDPFAAEVICSELLEISDETKVGKRQILEFCRSLALPPEPLDPMELAKMPMEEQNRYLQARNQNQSAKRERIQMILPTALASMRLLPGVYQKMMQYKSELTALRGDNPPPPTGEQHIEEDAEAATVEDFEPTNSALSELGMTVGKR